MTTTTNTSFNDLNVTNILIGLCLVWVSWKGFIFFKLFEPRNEHSLRSVVILVLGDIGRSPRMMYHAESFAENDFLTYVVGYGGSKPIPALERLPKVELCYLPEPPSFLKSVPFVIAAPFKILHQITFILRELLIQIAEPPEYLLVQNPPSIPTLALVWLVGRIRGCKVIIDWHNLGYSILALKLGESHPYVRIARWFEASFGRSAYAHLFVTEAMRDFLVNEWNLIGEKVVLHDRPPRHFHRSSPQEIHDLFIRLKAPLSQQKALSEFLPKSETPYSTSLTDTTEHLSPRPEAHDPIVSIGAEPISTTAPTYTRVHPPYLRPDRPALVVSSTSWTPDEDFGILLEALKQYELRATEINKLDGAEKLPKLLMAVTGKGPQREKYMKELNKLQKEWHWVRCVSLWLEPEDYPVFLGSANLGVCLHSSSSALDLPMKVVDMFGCGLPVCALDFKCLNELVKHGKNGLVFKDSAELAEQLESLLTSFPTAPRLASLQSSLDRSTEGKRSLPQENGTEWEWCTWDENWNRNVRPLLMRPVRI